MENKTSPNIAVQQNVPHSSLAKTGETPKKEPIGGLAGVGMNVIQGQKYKSNNMVNEEMGTGINKAIGPESSFHSEISKANMVQMPPIDIQAIPALQM